MKKIFTICICLFFTSCLNSSPSNSSSKGKYILSLSDVEGPYDAQRTLDHQEMIFEDQYLRIAWSYDTTRLGFFLDNKSDETMKIIWDEAAFIDVHGLTSRVFHKGVKFDKKEEHQPPTVVYKNSSLSDLIAPIDYSRYSSGYGKWVSDPIIPKVSNFGLRYINEYDSSLIFKDLRVVLPIAFQGKTNEYVFTFKIDYIGESK